MIARARLLKTLNMVAPAVGSESGFPILSRVWFTGSHVAAYNDRIVIVTPRATAFTGGVVAATLTRFLTTSRVAAVDLVADGDSNVVLRLGSAAVRLELLPLDDLLHHWQWTEVLPGVPDMPKQNCIDGIAGQVFAAIAHCLPSVSSYATIVERLGISVYAEHNKIHLCATDGDTLAHARLPLAKGARWPRRITLPVEFCTEMLKLAKRAKTVRLDVQDDHVLFAADDTLLFSRLLAVDHPINYARVLGQHMPERRVKALVDIPRRLPWIFEQAAQLDTGINERASLCIQGGEARLHMYTTRGEFTDTMQLPGHPDGECAPPAAPLRRAAAFNKILFSNDSVLLATGDMFYLVAALR
jgi:DNA polymerase III beta subunit, central domain